MLYTYHQQHRKIVYHSQRSDDSLIYADQHDPVGPRILGLYYIILLSQNVRRNIVL